jgi:hypothetical protein
VRRLREDEQVERLALACDVAAREREGALRIALDDEREHRLLAAVEDARLGALVRQGDPLAHLGDVARRGRAARQRPAIARRSTTVSVRASSLRTASASPGRRCAIRKSAYAIAA